jgi:1-phosphofructokinase family hexose kinase
MLLTVAPNPTIDRTLHVPQMTVGAVHRTSRVQLTAGGKGLNVGRVTQTLGYEVLLTGPLAGRPGQFVADLVKSENLSAAWHWLSEGETRICLLLNHDTGDATVINEAGPNMSAADWASFAAHVEHLAQRARAVAFAGSLMLGVEPEALGELARSLARPGRAIYVDTSGPALSAVLAQPEGLCVKVNQLELAVGLELKLKNRPINLALAESGRMLLDRGAALVVVTLGGNGALAIAPAGAWQASPPPVEVVSSVGSGDSMLAGLAVARLEGQALDAALAFAVACGSANAMSDLPGRFERTEVEALLKRVSTTRIQ